MKFVIQRVSHAKVDADHKTVGSIDRGFLVLIGVGQNDTRETADKLIKKMVGLRIFDDENGKTNLALKDVDGSLLLVSQFTLYADSERATGLLSSMQENRILQKNCMNISYRSAEKKFLKSRPGSSVRRWK